jgi:DNA-directed RNA polymerase I subunit RPA1
MFQGVKSVPSNLSGVKFSFFTTEEIRALSVKEICNPIAFDTVERPIPGGLYDPAMGVSPYDVFAACVTCGAENEHCPGHPGHIELALPIFNPFLFTSYLYKIVKGQCWSCHKIRIPAQKLVQFCVRMMFLNKGQIINAEEYEDLYALKAMESGTPTIKLKKDMEL